jgi:excisionase family DNA binding protein
MLTGDVARVLGVSAETVRFLHRIGRLPALKTERGVRLFALSDVDALKRKRDERRSASADPNAPNDAQR